MAKRRANGEGNIRKRKDGRLKGRYTAGHDSETVRAIYKNVLAKTQKECKEKLAQAIKKCEQVDTVKSEQYTVGQWMDIWFENWAKVKVRHSSHQTYRGYIENHIKPRIGDTRGPISPDSVLHMLHRVLKRAGLPEVRFHALRHTFATLALQNGVDIKTVSGMLGHYSAGFTLDTYRPRYHRCSKAGRPDDG